MTIYKVIQYCKICAIMKIQMSHVKAALVGLKISALIVAFGYVSISVWVLFQTLHNSLISAMP